jgi:hypothetical protein
MEEEEPLPPPPKLEDELHLVDPGPKRRSKFWNYYKAYDLDHHPDKAHTARCSLCGKDISVKQGTGGLVRHLQHRHADESDDLAAITASYPTPATLPRQSVGTIGEERGEEESDQPRKKTRVVGNGNNAISVDFLDAKIKREEHNLKMWRDAKSTIKELKEELASATVQEDIDEIEADIQGFRDRKALYAKLLGFDVMRSEGV